jgi:hypothetical protein
MIDIQISKSQLKRLNKFLQRYPKAAPKIISRSINKTATTARTDISRDVNKTYSLKVGAIKKMIRLFRATRRRWRADLKLANYRIPLKQFSARQIKSGVSYKIKKSGGRKKIYAFIAKMPSGHEGVFMRAGSEGNYVPRLPINEKHGPSLSAIFDREPGLGDGNIRKANRELEKQIDRQIAAVLRGY